MRTIFTTIISLVLCVASVSAQSPVTAGRAKSLDVSLGYAYINHAGSQSSRVSLSGVNGSATIGLNPRLAIKADVGYARSGNILGTQSHSGVLSYLAGPVFRPTNRRNFDPYVHALLGGARVSGPLAVNGTVVTGGWATSFAWAIGGGVDYRFSDSMALRTGVDYLRTRYYGPSLTIQGQSNIRVTAGVVYFFGTQPRRRR